MIFIFRILFLSIVCGLCCLSTDKGFVWRNLNLPRSHIPYFFTNNPSIRLECEEQDNCPFKDLIDEEKYWGYELPKCKKERCWMQEPNCSGNIPVWVKTRSEQLENFWQNADFGIIHARKKELTDICTPNSQDDSSLKCVSFKRYCEGKNIYIDLTSADIVHGNNRNRYREDVLGPGQIGGHCNLNKTLLKSEGEHKGPLQSWYAEIEHFTSLDFYPSKGENCDIVYDKPTYLIKLDAGINMYHHFCDFINLYASQHINNSFNTDVNIIMWDTSANIYGDFFSLTWKAFTDHPIIRLKDLDGKKICLKDAIFPLLARQRLGLYYNMPLIAGCEGSGLFQAFHEHITHRLGINQEGPLREKIRITLLVRNTQYRNIMNQDELISAMKTVGEFEVTVVEFNRFISFEDQLKISHNSDIFLGMHGAGLTHMLFQPKWGVVFELYNCEDRDCYHDLARLRGVKYMTWQKKDKLVQQDEGHHPTLGAHAKFTNYGFDVKEFMRLIFICADHVRSHPDFVKARQDRYDNTKHVMSDRSDL